MSGNTLLISCLTLIGIAAVLLSTSLGTTYWFEVTFYNGMTSNIHRGLFKICSDDKCRTFPKTPDSLKTIQGMLVSALILNVIGFIVMVHCGLMRNNILTKIHAWSCFFTCGLAGILGIASVSRYVVLTNDTSISTVVWNYGFSLHLAWLSSLLSITGGCIAIPVVNSFYWGRNGSGSAPAYLQPVVMQTVQHVNYPVPQGYPFPPQQQYWGHAQQPIGAYPPNAYGNPPSKPLY